MDINSGFSSNALPKMLFNLKLKNLKRLVVSLPVFALVFGVLWAVIFNSKNANYTHCRVSNVLTNI